MRETTGLRFRDAVCILLVFGIASLLTVGCSSLTSEGAVSAALLGGSESEAGSSSAPVSFEFNEDDMETYEGVPVGFTEEGYPFRGNPKAPLTIVEYSDYLCPFCARYTSATLPTLVESYVKTGQVKFVFRDMPLTSLHPTAPAGHLAASCAGEQGAALYWKMHDLLYFNQPQWNTLPNPTSYVANLAQQAGVEMDAYNECVNSGRMQSFIDRGLADGQALGFNGTPSFLFVRDEGDISHPFIGAQATEAFMSAIDMILAGEDPGAVDEAEQEPAELPYWANEEGLAPDPARPGYTMAGDQYKGDANAPLVVVEFSDFQCPACADHAQRIQPSLDERFVETGEIMWVFKHLPLSIHPQSPVAAVAAECAAAQGAFWEMHDLLFAQQDEWSGEEPEAVLVDLAGELGLSQQEFARCLESRQPLEEVLQDMWDGDGLISQTPSFIAISGGEGQIITGSLAEENFAKVLDALVEKAVEAE